MENTHHVIFAFIGAAEACHGAVQAIRGGAGGGRRLSPYYAMAQRCCTTDRGIFALAHNGILPLPLKPQKQLPAGAGIDR